MSIHILGICGTFMGGIALLARESGVKVSGSDENVYPPMSTMLESQGIKLDQGFKQEHLSELESELDAGEQSQVVVGNVMSRGKDVVEYVLNQNLPYTSGPQWLYENILKDRWVLAVSGTHGKTTTASILTWILEYAGLSPGFLIGGVPENFGVSARLSGDSPFFVVEADEYDTAFFDKRSKFVHYHPRTLVINNLEYDHADIFPDLNAIKTQFHHLIRMIPQNGLIVVNDEEENISDVIDQGCWTPLEAFSASADEGTDTASVKGWAAEYINTDGSEFKVFFDGQQQGVVNWSLLGKHNVSNALAAIAASRHAGVPAKFAIEALSEFKGIKRRMELRGEVNGVRVYDDFAHHPTAIETTLKGLRQNVSDKKIIAILEPRSNTMQLGVHKLTLAKSLEEADHVILFQPENVDWNMHDVIDALGDKASLHSNIDQLIKALMPTIQDGDHILVMSNGGFGGIHDKLLQQLESLKN
ncbi:UDP-N-acetylmuramate:L-alanyl-gamma-D-glutamyl-meso-diaminopimelate ligase [Cocleimonas sp. KMM 6892]|uniref:UDP-N-acetylmuramate:L-alanyl-gamma-D-glutamyl- meso-diaminopimelate ligase n=1 Tax=unclassified Cocleimonas TaxID=2639732 RepID=UPI002DB7AEEA|nr:MULTISPECIES: UDP-N-acetylmuramate:L-alanyl-gamma-D-glutamyl-meso-diaminopimelate ligase [unclassified Cocleimonas]MEB8432912.1 UDP-N-acetylmuramate:L-alanyl-gamma-D-glutamyl-meso-diaminopimelate ligase [Cocleimonas sp. KMM 6892]MEC4716107.1 UDP-N-acetylmuramate:L-alanyl-gamma-D-glutamyl-meso-diaminopimelate ligase [Cocleimonas sp. KMM 6895]MEC4745568.1 UDP-N-acetylmuramate:L-alanyl-gamma-D-glutamyl-meso-diaminopimelate ligase [Cocleimonas sp. KMM 6896]